MLDKTEKTFTDFIHDIRSDATKGNYARTLDQFISWTQTLEKKNQFKSYTALSKTTKVKIQPLLESYIQFLSDEKYPNSVPKYLDGPKAFLSHHDIDYNNKRLRKKYPKKKKPAGNEAYSIEQIQKLVDNAGSKRNKSLILCVASSGVRVGGIAGLRLRNIVDVEDCKLIVVYENEEEEYVTFITPEARKAFEEYIEERKSHGEKITGESYAFIHEKVAHSNFKNYDKYKPITEELIRQLMLPIIKNAKIDRKRVSGTKRYRIAEVHGLRKFFATAVNRAKIEVGHMEIPAISHNDIEKILGHKNGLKGLYYDPQNLDLFKEYKKAIHELTISAVKRTLAENLRLEEEKSELQNNSKKLDECFKQIDDLKKKLNKFQTF
ncbi:tyrosine recombinase XerC [archaeon MnTg01]|nr:tyrosine recombinase XerC [archaeon MnTg01]